MKRVRSFRWVEVLIAAALALMTAGAFLFQVFTYSDQTTQLEILLFSLLQFILAVGFAWFSTRAISREEFRGSLRQFAIGAYRRISDIEAILKRLRGSLGDAMAEAPSPVLRDLRVIEAYALDAGQVVKSSVADWGDVIGEELSTLEEIEKLQQRREGIGAPRSDEALQTDGQRLEDIDREIEDLIQRLPKELQIEVKHSAQKEYERQRAAEWIADEHALREGLVLSVVTGTRYYHTRDKSSLKEGEELTTRRNKHDALDVIDHSGQTLGRLQNFTPLSYTEFVEAMAICFGPDPLDLEYVEDAGEETRGGEDYGWFLVRVRNRPLVLMGPERDARRKRRDAAEHGL